MEPPLKRLRLFEPAKSELGIAFDSENYSDIYDDEDTALEVDEDGQEEDDIDIEPGDPDAQLEHTRALLDLKLKSKFEAIFEKYGRDFTGIGDEIDLRTGEIVVDNGHLHEMEDERDDGTGRPSLLEAFTQEPDEVADSTEAEDNEQDEIHESHVKLEDMEEDDMILFHNPGVAPSRPKTPPSFSSSAHGPQLDHEQDSKYFAPPKTLFPSEREILVQFGQELGPKIARYVSQQQARDDSAIEPAWRTPGLPLATPGKRPILKSILLQPDSDRSPSPKGSSSVWAPKMPRGRPRRDGADVAAVFRGETIIRDRTWYSSGYVSTTVTKQCTERVGHNQSKRIMSVPLDENLNNGKSKVEPNLWANSRKIASRDMYGSDENPDEESDSSEEKVAKFYKPRRPWANPGIPVLQKTSENFDLHSKRTGHEDKDNSSSKRGRKPYVPFTEADDEALLEWVEEVLKKGLALWSITHWKMLAEKNPRHSYVSWMDRYRRRFWQKGIIPSIEEGKHANNSQNGTEPLQAVHQTKLDSRYDLEENSTVNECSHEALQGALTSMSRTSPGTVFSQEDSCGDSKIGALDPEVLDPVLQPQPAIDHTKLEEPDNVWQQRSNLSRSLTVDPKRAFSVPCIISDSMSAVEGPRSSSVPRKMNFNAESSSFLNREVDRQTHEAVDISKDYHEFGNDGNQTTPETESHQNRLSTDEERVMKGLEKPQGVQTLQQTPRKAFDLSYDFSDEEDEVDSVQPCASSRLEVVEVLTNTNSAKKKQIIDLTMEDPIATDEITLDRQAIKNIFYNRPQAPISVSSSSPVSDKPDPEEEEFFLEPSAPAPPAPNSNLRLSGILGIDDFEELRKSSPVSLRQSPEERSTESESRDMRNSPLDGVGLSPTLKLTPKWKKSTGNTRANILKRCMDTSPSGPTVETPGGSKRRCGENGFKCGRGFCFKCLEG